MATLRGRRLSRASAVSLAAAGVALLVYALTLLPPSASSVDLDDLLRLAGEASAYVDEARGWLAGIVYGGGAAPPSAAEGGKLGRELGELEEMLEGSPGLGERLREALEGYRHGVASATLLAESADSVEEGVGLLGEALGLVIVECRVEEGLGLYQSSRGRAVEALAVLADALAEAEASNTSALLAREHRLVYEGYRGLLGSLEKGVSTAISLLDLLSREPGLAKRLCQGDPRALVEASGRLGLRAWELASSLSPVSPSASEKLQQLALEALEKGLCQGSRGGEGTGGGAGARWGSDD